MEILEIVGYTASGIVALSMTMSSIVKFRWINFVGALLFSIYGFIIGAIPVGLLNGFIVSVDIYYLIRIYGKKQDLFSVLEVQKDSNYLLKFLDFHKEDMQKFFPGFEYKPELNTISFYILRNMAVAGVFLAHGEGKSLKVGMDYVISQYRDYQNGRYVYHRLKDKLQKSGFEKIRTYGYSARHVKYLKKMGFKETKDGLYYEKMIT
ncbi:MAG: hypothetical protein U9N85_01440 [Bacteroidota bacterium]|nr:hypothetical protein [Bacteroidota bacterium]